MGPEVFYIPNLDRMLGRSESAIRSALQAKTAWLPPLLNKNTDFAGGSHQYASSLRARKHIVMRERS